MLQRVRLSREQQQTGEQRQSLQVNLSGGSEHSATNTEKFTGAQLTPRQTLPASGLPRASDNDLRLP